MWGNSGAQVTHKMSRMLRAHMDVEEEAYEE